MDELIGEFLAETAESLDTIDVELVKFESDPTDRATLDNIFRLLHTIKGTCGFLGLSRLEAVAHAGETLLGKFRDGTLVADSAAVTLVLQSLDRIKLVLGGLEETGSEPEGDDSELIAKLEALAMGETVEAAPEPEPEPEPEPVIEVVAEGGEAFDADLGRPLRPGEVSLADLEAAFMATEGPELAGAAAEDEAEAETEAEAEDDDEAPVPVAAMAAGKPAAQTPPADTDGPKSEGVRAQSTIRVNVDVLETLMTTVSELVLARNQLHQIVRENEDSALKGPLQRLSSVTGELQDGVMKTRMQPVGDAWRKLPRIVRDTQQDLGKKIRLIMEGEETELDRQVLELIKDPLTHMVRNSADHGIEMPDVRTAKGKPAQGTIRLSAYHEGGAIIIKITDDGAGLDPEKIRAKALEKGLATAEELSSMSEPQVQRFIFAAGFSTAAKVTNLSGRGVGMDVVRTNIEQIGGSIDLTSEVGKGTSFAIKIPLTLAIVSALIVKAGDARFALPQLAVRELVRAGEGSAHSIESLHGARMIRLRNRLLPVVSLNTVLGLPDASSDASHGYVVVIEAAGRKLGVVVDDVLDTEEIVVKPLSAQLRGIQVYSGATLLGDGSVIIILDPNGLSQQLAHATEETPAAEELAASSADPSRQRLLLVRAGEDDVKAVPVSLITRLEEFDGSTIEVVDARHVVQYRGRLLPLAHASGVDEFRRDGRQAVLVFSEEGRSAGVAVDEILDVVEETLDLQMGSERPGVIGSAIIKGRATEVLDIAWHMERAWSGSPQRPARSGRHSILLVEPDAFARRMMAPLLAAAGYDVTVVGGLHEARDAAQMGAQYAALVGDPAALDTLAGEGHWADVPRLGVSDRAHGGYGEGLVAVMRPADRGGLIAALDRAARSGETRAA
ncbi:CheA signal transduction histidine kinase [Glycocaulis alkaliphilus]|uniref:Chemotaxis protein CheA n=1 Tax=Glycocaulis alkaliphilus TaxID=1434191 RepID=A0A3T0ECC3_9PROT|nr:chemotaxis protein CheA [Glycocaulis alkaliphilus]AZU04934.1 CheA signal transduction histidine kinase [Glycocaulis alkaliphilus]GGB66541.1 ATPase [Glycocaulis alkaliphilus]